MGRQLGKPFHDLLLVEDTGDDIDLMLRAVQSFDANLKIAVAFDGQEALNLLQSDVGLPKLVLMDLHLPRLNGIEVLQRLRTEEIRRCPPIVLFSGSASKADIMQAYRCGVNSWIHKPTKFEEVQAVVHRILFYWLTVNAVPDELLVK
jgi:two-component system response regulator